MFRFKLEIAAKAFLIFVLPVYIAFVAVFLIILHMLAGLPYQLVSFDPDTIFNCCSLFIFPALFITAAGAWGYAGRCLDRISRFR